MATEESRELLAFNRGVIDSKGLARIDLERMAMSAERQRNWIPRVLGSMIVRPGLEFIGHSYADAVSRQFPFIFSVGDTAQIEITPFRIRVRVDDVLISYPAVSATISNPTFSSLTNWNDEDETGGSSSNGVIPIYGVGLTLIGDGEDRGMRVQEVTVTETGTEHALDILVNFGVVTLRVGSGTWSLDKADEFITETQLGSGHHMLSFTPDDDFWVELSNAEKTRAHVGECNMSPTGDMILDNHPRLNVPFDSTNLGLIRMEQSGDVIYVSVQDERHSKIERRGTRSWSLVDYLPLNGPFRTQNITGTTITPSAITGTVTLTSSKPVFKSAHATALTLFRIASQGQVVTAVITAQDTFTDPIRVVGSEDARKFGVIVEGSFTAVVTLQFAFTEDGPWNDLGTTYSSPTSTNYTDGQDGQIIYYRIGVKTGDYTSGTVTVTLTYTGGSIQGIARIVDASGGLTATADVIQDFGSIDASKDWWEGEWSAYRGYPTAVALHEGRLWWGGSDNIFGSVSDGYEDWDDNTEGDAQPIKRSIGFGPIRIINWLLSMGRLLMGTSDTAANIAAVKFDGNNVLGARSNSFDEPLTVGNFNIKSISSKGLFVDRTGQRLYELTYNLDEQDYKSLDLSIFCPDFNVSGIVQIAVQMKPDVRIHCVRNDGTVGILIFDRIENVICWVDVDSSGAGGLIEDVAVLPNPANSGEDQIYYTVKRTINSLTERHICKWALENEVIGGTVNKLADSFVHYSGAATTTPFTTELLHLRDETVVVWADGIDVGEHTVSAAGAITLAVAAAEVVAGLGYTAQFKSSKLAELTGIGLLERKKVNKIGFIAENMHYQGLQYGADFDNLSDLPKVSRGQVQSDNQIYAEYHEDNFPFGGTWIEDARICLQAAAPRPCTIKAVIAEMQSVEHKSPRSAPRRS